MANITEVSQWENVIRQLENGEAATGGADGLANIQAKQLANRTKWLKDNLAPIANAVFSGTMKHGANDLAGSAIVAKSLGLNGYVKYASGLIIQWGHVDAPNNDTTWTQYTEPSTSETCWKKTITFPVSFSPNNCKFFCIKPIMNGLWKAIKCESYGYATDNIDVYVNYHDVSFKWFAIGY